MNYTVFVGPQIVAEGDLAAVVPVLRGRTEGTALVFEDETGRQVDLDLRDRPPEGKRVGRPKLGVVAREVTLLPRHWEWLAAQPGGASVALRRLVEEARKANAEKELRRQAVEALGRFLLVMAGNEAGYEEALRAIYRGERAGYEAAAAGWPEDVRAFAGRYLERVFGAERERNDAEV